MSAIFITPYSAVEATVKRHKPSHVITLLDPQTLVATPRGIARERHLRLGIDDITEPAMGSVVPSSEHVSDILAFAKSWDRKQPILVHCWAGISRSTAAAFILLSDIHGAGSEYEIARGLRARAPHAQPNRLMVRHADALMGRGGHMIDAVATMGPARVVWEGEVVELPLLLDEL